MLNDLAEIKNDWRIFWGTLQDWGPTTAITDFIRYLRAKRQEKAEGFDERYGVQTSRMVGIRGLQPHGPNLEHATYYWPTRPAEFGRIMRSLEPIEHNRYTFVDLGCGKGRVLLLAAAYEFARVVGVDFSPGLIRDARQNLERYTGPKNCSAMEALVGDATEFEFPDGNLLVYMFDPFDGPVMTTVLRNLHLASQRQEREILVVYYFPDDAHVFTDAGYEQVMEGRGDSWPWHVYRPVAPRP